MTTATASARLPLESGDRLSRSEFQRRYASHPEIRKAELVEGVVYVASPVGIRDHAVPHAHLVAWLGVFASKQPGLLLGDNGSVDLDADNAVQPDAFLALPQGPDGGTRLTEHDHFAGAPELVAEVAASSASYDLHDKLRAYRRSGVREYIVWQVLEGRIDWFQLREGEYVPLPADERGVVHSEVFPGLRLNVAAMLAGDLAAVLG